MTPKLPTKPPIDTHENICNNQNQIPCNLFEKTINEIIGKMNENNMYITHTRRLFNLFCLCNSVIFFMVYVNMKNIKLPINDSIIDIMLMLSGILLIISFVLITYLLNTILNKKNRI